MSLTESSIDTRGHGASDTPEGAYTLEQMAEGGGAMKVAILDDYARAALDVADWDAVLDTNLKAVFRASRAVMRTMMKQRYGRIINITSVVGASGNPGQANYAAAKAGVAGMTRALARELGSRNITVNCVAPGFIDTDMTRALTEEQHTALKAQIPLGRLGQPEDIAKADEDKLREQVALFRERLDTMGPINPMAMEAYTEIKQRNDFIIAQKEDLLKAKESLFTTINEIETVASQTFMDAFQQIKEHFINVFRSLFTEGDECDLKLVDPTKPLESDIDIIAKPKGKRPLTINQLSGGEKTLTATALLFAMYLLKPAPFCIFDEVDAPLDDANIDKFNNIIRTFSKDSQFVIVTHNKRTMTTTDVIYGITMIEKGISRVVPVDLRELA